MPRIARIDTKRPWNSCHSWLIPSCNGNMTGRTVGGVTYTLVYDAENRLQQRKLGSTVLASYTCDGGKRVRR